MKKNPEERSSVTLHSNGLKVFGVLHMPEGQFGTKVPVVLFCHGFGGHKSGKFRLNVRLAEMLSKIGIASLRIDFRGSGDSEGDFADTTIQTQLEDARVGLQYLLEHTGIDPNKIALVGRSLGGAIATQLASEFTKLKALALWCPLFDAKPWMTKNTKNFCFSGQNLSSECIRQFTLLDTTKPLLLLNNVPMLIVHAANDEILSPYHHEQYFAHRKESSSTKTLELTKSNHEFSNIAEQQLLLDTTTAFFRGIL